MICPHCGKDSNLVYIDDNTGITRKEAERMLKDKIAGLDALRARGAYKSGRGYRSELEEKYDKILRECSMIEVALGY